MEFHNSNTKITDDDIAITKVKSILRLIKISVTLFLCMIATGLGTGSYYVLYNKERLTFTSQFSSAVTQIDRHLAEGLKRTELAHMTVSNMHRAWTKYGNIGTMPNVTIPGKI